MNQKIQRVVNEIEKTQAKIAELQARLPVLEKQKTDLENIEIVTAVRSANVPPAELTEFIRAYKAQLAALSASNKNSETEESIIEEE